MSVIPFSFALYVYSVETFHIRTPSYWHSMDIGALV